MDVSSPSGVLWAIVTVVGGFLLLGGFMLFARIRNKQTETPEGVARTERATHDLYKEQDRMDRANDSAVDRERI